jgi:hypothetical protein
MCNVLCSNAPTAKPDRVPPCIFKNPFDPHTNPPNDPQPLHASLHQSPLAAGFSIAASSVLTECMYVPMCRERKYHALYTRADN